MAQEYLAHELDICHKYEICRNNEKIPLKIIECIFIFLCGCCKLFQELALYGEFTLRETLLYFGWIAGMATSDVDEKIDFLIRLLQLPSVTRFVKSLSGGQQRRMSLAAALLHGNIEP